VQVHRLSMHHRLGKKLTSSRRKDNMGLSIGIVGLPNVGKSTLFNALTKNQVLAANYPFATIEPNIGVVPLPDPRLNALADLYNSARIVPATVTFVDIAGIVKGASKGEGLGNKFLSAIKECDAICQVVRVFDDPDVIHVDGAVSPSSDIETINTELILADLQTIENRLVKLEKEAKKNPELKPVLEAAVRAFETLNGGKTLYSAEQEHAISLELLKELHLLTAKPFIYVFNVDESSLTDKDATRDLAEMVKPAKCVTLSAQFEAELASLDPVDAKELLSEYGLEESGLEQLARVGFETLGLQTFLTSGTKETRAWTIKKGSTAPQAAGTIHSDFERGFIKAEVVSYADLVELGSVAAVRSAGKARVEGKEYVMQDGDVVEFRFNV
jgi:GTP-binding protein YchF